MPDIRSFFAPKPSPKKAAKAASAGGSKVRAQNVWVPEDSGGGGAVCERPRRAARRMRCPVVSPAAHWRDASEPEGLRAL